MACFLVTTAAAIGVATAKYVVRHQEKKKDPAVVEEKLINSKELKYLELTLWGGSFVLAGEHVIHGEVTFKFPFLTAISEGQDATLTMLKEMGTVGVSMLAILVVAWFSAVLIIRHFKKKKLKEALKEQ